MNDFIAQISTVIDTTVLTPIIAFLKEKKNVDITLEELHSVLALPAGAQPPPFPGTFTGLQAVATGRSARGKKPTSDCPKCEYILTRGDNPGTQCGKAGEITPLGPRCRQHAGKKGGGATERVGKKQPSPGLVDAVPKEQKEQELSVTRIPGTDYYREISTGAVLKSLPEGGVAAIGIEENGDIRPLTENESATLSARGIVIKPLPAQNEEPTLNALPTL